MSFDYKQMGAHIRKHRARKDLSQEALAEKASIDRAYLSRIENGEKYSSIETIVSIANALGVSANALLEDSLVVKPTPQSEVIIQLLHDCSPEEEDILIKNMAALKSILKGYSIRK